MHNAILNIFSLLLLYILFVYSIKRLDKNSFQQQIYVAMLLCTALLLILDILGRFDGNPDTLYSPINRVSNFLLFILNPLLPSMWFLYVHYQLYHDKKRTMRWLYPLLVLMAANTLMIILSQFNGWYYSIDDGNIYHRGPLFLLATALTISLMVASFADVLLHRKQLAKKHLFPLILFPLPPFVGVLLQIIFYGVCFALNGTVLSLLIVILCIQDDDMYTDYLTGVGNRKKLEALMKERVSRSSPQRTFSLIMLDIDRFKEINDSFGHDMGDKVLKASAEALEKSVRSRDYVTRYGGDEFCLILDVSDEKSLQAAAFRIDQEFRMLDHADLVPFGPSFSMGYAVYDCEAGLSVEEFLKRVDTLLYENKRLKRGAEDKVFSPYHMSL